MPNLKLIEPSCSSNNKSSFCKSGANISLTCDFVFDDEDDNNNGNDVWDDGGGGGVDGVDVVWDDDEDEAGIMMPKGKGEEEIFEIVVAVKFVFDIDVELMLFVLGLIEMLLVDALWGDEDNLFVLRLWWLWL